jgi:NAD(P)H-flavin reductase
MNHDITSLFSKYKNTHIHIVAGADSQLNVYIREWPEINRDLFVIVSELDNFWANFTQV